jgi:outer membrane receptor protein involved in Fe transport
MYRLTAIAVAVLGALSIAETAAAQAVSTSGTEGGQEAKDTKSAPHSNSADASNRLGFDTVVVTGTGVARRKFDTSYAISNISASEIQKLAPLNTADLVGQMPGVQAEATGGEAQNIYRVRGIPNEGNFFAFEEDGMLIYGENEGYFFKGDVLIRPDMMTESVEVVRGGPAPIFADNAAAIFNLITRQGGETDEHGARLTLGNTGLRRFDGFVSGKLADKTYYALGGFYRENNGPRNNGFPSDTGGQLRLNILHKLDNGEVKLFAKTFDDHNVFLLPIPVADPRDPQKSLNPYIDYFTGTLNSPYLRNAQFVYPNVGGSSSTTESRDLSNGRHLKYFNTGMDVDLNLGQWQLSNKLRLTTGKLDFDALYSTVNPVDANQFAASNLAAAKKAFGANVVALGYTYAGRSATYDPYASSGLVMQAGYRAVQDDFKSVSDDLRLTRDFELAGKHRLTGGLLLSRYTASVNARYQDYLLQLSSQPQPLDLVAYDASGKALGRVTDNGVLRYASTLVGGESTVNQTSIYFADTWKLGEKWAVDLGARSSAYRGDGFSKDTARYNLGDGSTLADDSTLGFTGANTARSIDGQSTSWTLGVNYDFTKNLGVYGRSSVAYRLPSESNIYTTGAAVTTKARQYEAGIKFSTKELSVFATAFLSEFNPFSTTVAEINPATGLITNQTFVGKVTSPGVELEFSWRPNKHFSLDGATTFNDPKSGNMVSTDGNVSLTTEGKMPIRQPKYWGNIRPTVHFALADWQASAYARYNFTGKRFVDLQNLTELPAYQTLELGITASKNDYTIQLVVDNVTNAQGLTEGNPRADAIAGQGSATAIYGRPLYGRGVRLLLSKEF